MLIGSLNDTDSSMVLPSVRSTGERESIRARLGPRPRLPSLGVTPPFGHPVGFAAQFLTKRGIDRLRFAEAEQLLGHGAELVDETARVKLTPGQRVLVMQAIRATHTFEAVIALCQI